MAAPVPAAEHAVADAKPAASEVMTKPRLVSPGDQCSLTNSSGVAGNGSGLSLEANQIDPGQGDLPTNHR